MLLLVFVLVLIALGMLAVALYTSSVLWGWIALLLSAAAAVVLVIDWLQRRSAVKAGSAGSTRAVNTAVAPGSVPGFGQPSGAGLGPAPVGHLGPLQPPPDVDPVTEVLPLVQENPPLEAGNATEDTAVLPVIGPSGSAEQPPGATEGITQMGGDSSRSVVAEEGAPGAGTEGAAPAWQGGEAVPQGGSGPEGDSAPQGDAGAHAGPGPQDDDVTEIGGPPVADADGVTVIVPLSAGGVADAAGVADAGPQEAEAAPGEAAAPGRPAEHHPGEEPAVPAAPGSEQGSADELSADEIRAHELSADEARAEETRAEAVSAEAVRAQAVGADEVGAEETRMTGGLFAADAFPPAGPDGQPPEEPRDAEIAAVVAGLDDEVLVVDEQPRYHVVRCRSLQGKPLIPLPVREAVELGFTPCGWCTPDRVLAGDRAEAR